MSSQQHLKESLRSLGYYPSDDSEIPELPDSCLSLLSTLCDDITHSQTRITRLETELDKANENARKLNIQLGSIELTASKIASDNNRLRDNVLEIENVGGGRQQKEDKIIELEYLLGEYKKRYEELKRVQVQGTDNEGEHSTREIQFDLNSLEAEKGISDKRTKELEKAVQKRDFEIDRLQNLLGEGVVSNIPDPTTRLIYLEEYSRSLEQMLMERSGSSSTVHPSRMAAGNDEDFTKTSLYETLTAELLAYKRQRDNARDKATKYKSRWNETAEELKLQTSKFELLAKEFRRIIKLEEKPFKGSSRGTLETKH